MLQICCGGHVLQVRRNLYIMTHETNKRQAANWCQHPVYWYSEQLGGWNVPSCYRLSCNALSQKLATRKLNIWWRVWTKSTWEKHLIMLKYQVGKIYLWSDQHESSPITPVPCYLFMHISSYLVLDSLPTQGSKQNNKGKINFDFQQHSLSSSNTYSTIEQCWEQNSVICKK